MRNPSAVLPASALAQRTQECRQNPETIAMPSNCDFEIDENEGESLNIAAKKTGKRTLNETLDSLPRKVNVREKRIVLPSGPVAEKYSFPRANKWGREELRRLGVEFHPHPNVCFSKLGHLTHGIWQPKFSDTLQERIALARSL